MIDRPDWGNGGSAIVPATATPEQVIHEIATSDTPSAATQSLVESNTNRESHLPVPAKGRGFSGLPDWTDKPPRDEQGRFIAKASDAGLVQTLGLAPEVAEVL